MVRMHRLGGEEMMAKIDVLGVVPVGDIDGRDRMSFVVCRVVDQYRDGAQPRARVGNRLAQRLDVGDVSPNERHLAPAVAQLTRQSLPRFLVDVYEGDAAVVAREGADDLGADAGRAAAYEHHSPGEARIGGEGHISASAMSSSVCGSNRQACAISTPSARVSPG
jgi:hypothetical protein